MSRNLVVKFYYKLKQPTPPPPVFATDLREVSGVILIIQKGFQKLVNLEFLESSQEIVR